MANVKNPFLFAAPRVLFYHRVQMVVPALTTLLANPAIKMFSNLSPFLGALFLNQSEHHSVFLFGPRTFDKAGVENLLPPMQTLHVSPAREILSNFFPVFLVVPRDRVGQN